MSGGGVLAAVALGSNLGDRHAHLDFALDRLAARLGGLLVSPRYETAPVGVPGQQPPYLNAAAVGFVNGTPRELLEFLLHVERERGRERPFRNAPRTLDLDLILFGEMQVDEAGLVVPHPRFAQRLFVLQPLADIAPQLRDPRSGLTIAALLHRLQV